MHAAQHLILSLGALAGLACANTPVSAPVQQAGQEPEPGSADVRLVVLISVDQMIPEQLDRLAPWYTGGLARIARSGWVLTEAALEHGLTETGPGHASLGTGCHPVGHGLRANSWWSVAAQGWVYCVEDADAVAVTPRGAVQSAPYAGRGRSPRNIQRPGLADYLRAAHPESRSFSISCKDRAAIGMAGQDVDLALWWDRNGAAGFISSTWYTPTLPAWVVTWDEAWVEHLLAGPFGAGWAPGFELELEGSRTAPDARPGEAGSHPAFPHALPALGEPPLAAEVNKLASMVYDTAIGDAFVFELARRGVGELELGADEHPDLLALSLSGCDTAGHAYGPYSREVTDVMLRVDRGLGELFDLLDERVGAGRWIAALSSDHGVLPLPEYAPAGGGVRVPSADLRAAFEAVRADLRELFGSDFDMRVVERGLVFSPAAVAASEVVPDELRAAAAELLLGHGAEWLAATWTKQQLRAVATGGASSKVADLLRFEANSFVEDSTPDVVFTPAPRHLLGMRAGTTHGTPHPYDRRIPLCFLGPGFTPGRSGGRAASVDVLPTLLDRLGIEPAAGLDGVVLRPE